MSDSERQYKLMDVTDFSLYWDTEMVGQEEEEDLVVSEGEGVRHQCTTYG